MRWGILVLAVLLAVPLCAGGGDNARADEFFPIYPPYPYRAGHYPTADSYYRMPPYVAIKPSYYRKRYFMMAQERNRYRYMPHVFHGYGDEDGTYLK